MACDRVAGYFDKLEYKENVCITISGCLPSSTKAALVKPLIKKHSLDCNILNNYRAVLSTVIERAVAFYLSRKNGFLADEN